MGAYQPPSFTRQGTYGPYKTPILAAFKQAIRSQYRGRLRGGYTIALYMMNGERICNSCAREQWPEICSDTIDGYGQWQAGHTEVYWEGPPQHCVQCNKPQDSEYGDPTLAAVICFTYDDAD